MSWEREDYSLSAWEDSARCLMPPKVPDFFPGSKVWVPRLCVHPEGKTRTIWEPGVIVSTRGQSDQATPLKGPFPVRVEFPTGKRKWVSLKRLRPLEWKEE